MFYRFFLYLSVVLLVGCSSTHRIDNAHDIAKHADLYFKAEKSGPFMLTRFERIRETASAINVYIEGDGFAWLDKRTPSSDPTPKNPVALRLAAKDPAPNIIYLSRPCQFTKMSIEGTACPQKYWTTHRFSEDVVLALDNSLDQIQKQYNTTGFHLIGYSGGAAVAALLTNKRDDILSLRTVAGNLDHKLFNRIHNVDQMYGSLNAADIANHIVHIPQHHFVGKEDQVVPKPILESFLSQSQKKGCITTTILQGISHQKGWKDIWKNLLQLPISCKKSE